MAKALYTLEMFINLKEDVLNGLRDVCIFVVCLHVEEWFVCTDAKTAPNQDYQFIRDVIRYKDIDSKVSEVVLKKMTNHLWYLSEATVALSFFDEHISNREKKRMISRFAK